ncbi:helix-hairpin-helix domain-containing protein [Streptococcus iniae]|uniref:helix-hairpin-helix domain-containing protein n=1 Tax=Streptococcus iniae TaxID=1346 RepID=UPI002B320AD7|nr:helix-hairpin-helix domain-containing protein [Streptococcus iniae]WNZ90314.1 helix-hairpin-helix domain-containing protein [Streptococcus iniae]WNZ91954.1 helix-hairpin-helix domain-containing protein [Streptococcus iniae]WNZ93366.1 helix-hairpin-helix domain-containing protein [Streptococcus iniae]WNZ94594.1 helix-hairpin-helix domain-containing protein [Streptococcus iniae]
MAKQKNRKKALRLALKRQGLLTKVEAGFDKVVDSVETVADKALTVGKELVEKGSDKIESIKAQVAGLSLEEFSAQKELDGIRANLIETFYNEGIHSVSGFSQWTEKDLLSLKGIGPATVNKLVENGINLKK